jgi:hypothetical protein
LEHFSRNCDKSKQGKTFVRAARSMRGSESERGPISSSDDE